MTENEISKIIVDAAFHVHKKLGPGLLESVYEVILAHGLKSRGLKVDSVLPPWGTETPRYLNSVHP